MGPPNDHGHVPRADRHTGIFDFGCMLYEMFTGRKASEESGYSDFFPDGQHRCKMT
jgi:hypothetical protein